MANEFFRAFGPDVAISLTPGANGRFEVRLDGEKIFDRKEEGNIRWSEDAQTIERLVRAFTPWPGTHTFWNGQQLKILKGAAGDGQAQPGLVVNTGGTVAIGTGNGLFYPLEVQLAGRRALHIQDFVRGQPRLVGAILTS